MPATLSCTRAATSVAILMLLAHAAPAQVPAVPAGSKEQQIVLSSTQVFEQMLQNSATGIPQSMLEGAEAVAIIPSVVKGGFVIGARYGRGLVVTRDPNGQWHAPIFLTITGGNIGWQAGVQAIDVVQVYRTPRSVQSLMSGKMTLGGDVSAAAGPVGREASAKTDTTFSSEVYSYSRSRGLFAGAALDGSVVKIDHAATAAYYNPPPGSPPGTTAVVPAEAQNLVNLVVAQVEKGGVVTPPEPGAQPTFGASHTIDQAAAIRDQLSEFAPQLYRKLDPRWQQYLSLPADIFKEDGHPSPDQVNEAVRRFDEVSRNPQYAGLAARPEFQTVHGLLRHYQQLMVNPEWSLQLPPPPGQ